MKEVLPWCSTRTSWNYHVYDIAENGFSLSTITLIQVANLTAFFFYNYAIFNALLSAKSDCGSFCWLQQHYFQKPHFISNTKFEWFIIIVFIRGERLNFKTNCTFILLLLPIIGCSITTNNFTWPITLPYEFRNIESLHHLVSLLLILENIVGWEVKNNTIYKCFEMKFILLKFLVGPWIHHISSLEH